MVLYMGIFFDLATSNKLFEAEKTHLKKRKETFHITLLYKPKKEDCLAFNRFINKEFEVKVIGYACDGKNSGFKVELTKEFSEYCNKVMHITTSIAVGEKNRNTEKLEFEPLSKTFKIKGKCGLCYSYKGKRWISFEKFDIENNGRNKNRF